MGVKTTFSGDTCVLCGRGRFNESWDSIAGAHTWCFERFKGEMQEQQTPTTAPAKKPRGKGQPIQPLFKQEDGTWYMADDYVRGDVWVYHVGPSEVALYFAPPGVSIVEITTTLNGTTVARRRRFRGQTLPYVQGWAVTQVGLDTQFLTLTTEPCDDLDIVDAGDKAEEELDSFVASWDDLDLEKVEVLPFSWETDEP